MDGLEIVDAAPEFAIRREWPVKKLWHVAKIRSEKKRPDLPLLSVFLGRGVIAYGEGGGQVHKPGRDLSIYQVVHEGDFVLNNQQAWRGSVGVSRHHGIISPAYVVLKLDASLNPRFADYLFQSHPMVAQNVTASKGVGDIQRDIHIPWLKNNKVPIPPPDEQAAIVRFLDHANGRIERAIRAKRKLIALLNEQKQAIIHRAVTRGLNPNVPLKPSGIPWLGEIPQHWQTRPLKQLLVRMDYGTSENARGEGKVRVLGMGHIREGKIFIPKNGSLDRVPLGLLLERNDLLFNRTNSPELVGKVGLFEGDAADEITFASYLVRLRVRESNSPHWLNYLLNSTRFWSFAKSQALVSLHQANLNSSRYARMVLPVPPTRTEQDKIVQEIQSQTSVVEKTLARADREIELLREYRTRLTADVVTGKLDVRAAAAKLPEEIEPIALAAAVSPNDTELETVETE
jgi:Restriction endonuclease S subunits